MFQYPICLSKFNLLPKASLLSFNFILMRYISNEFSKLQICSFHSSIYLFFGFSLHVVPSRHPSTWLIMNHSSLCYLFMPFFILTQLHHSFKLLCPESLCTFSFISLVYLFVCLNFCLK